MKVGTRIATFVYKLVIRPMRLLAVVSLISVTSVAYALDGNALYDLCQGLNPKTGEASAVSLAMCVGYVHSFADINKTVLDTTGARVYCPSSGVIIQQNMEIFVMWLAQNPDKRHLPADRLLSIALSEAFPCN